MSTTCKERVRPHYNSRMADILKLWAAYRHDPDADDPELGRFNEYGLAFDYVPPCTFTDQKRGYFRWQLSTGGPGDEFRFFTDETLQLTHVEYWFLDWFDGAKIIIGGPGMKLLQEIWEDWRDSEVPHHAMKEATQ